MTAIVSESHLRPGLSMLAVLMFDLLVQAAIVRDEIILQEACA
jgi:hypothetical protein